MGVSSGEWGELIEKGVSEWRMVWVTWNGRKW
jgi:hypothetical protein